MNTTKNHGTLIFFIFAALMINVIVLNFVVFNLKQRNDYLEQLLEEKSSEVKEISTPQVTNPVISYCPSKCLAEIITATASVSLKSPVVPTVVTKTTVIDSGVKEYFITLGTGSVETSEWVDVPGVTASINKSVYKSIKTVTFEASLEIPTGNGTGYVRLYNVSDRHPVWFSEMSMEGFTGKLLTSPAIQLDDGNKVYQVQIKNSLRALTKLNQARIRILLN